MNLYVVTEGKVESTVYRHWIPFVNPSLVQIDSVVEVRENNFYMISGLGYPGYLNIIENAILDINNIGKFDRLVISVDSENKTKQEKHDEIATFVLHKTCAADIRIVVQHFCFETWALGNRRIVRPHLSSSRLREYKRLFDVRSRDPELLPHKPDENLNRAQFAEKYLHLALNDRFRNLTYTKSNPQAVVHDKYFEQVKNRLQDTGHIASFDDFLRAFVE
jgi:hypothetical protein